MLFCKYQKNLQIIDTVEIGFFGDVMISGKLINYCRKHGNDVTSKSITEGYSFFRRNQGKGLF